MKYISTRGIAPSLEFEDVLLTGLAPDGGLYVPDQLPTFSAEEIAGFAALTYPELAFEIIAPFVAGSIPAGDLRDMLDQKCSEFRHPAVTPLVQLGTNEWLLELFHGPTLAFKDVALQLLGKLFDFVLKQRQQQVVVLGATSGDTGSAAIEGCRHSKQVDIFILHPHQRVSEVQRRQMTAVTGENVHNIAVEGNFDDCQALVKASFADQGFLPDGRQLVAVNSINWARIMAQIVYYFYAAAQLGAPHRQVSFSVPTGNFGDIFAGYLAKKMGLPIEQLVIATNSNDILHRILSANDYSRNELMHTLSPSMDIMISSNFERMLFDLYDRDGAAIREMMERFKIEPLTLSDKALHAARELFSSHRVDDAATCATIKEVYSSCEYLLDPHTAIGLNAARACWRNRATPMVTLATAHPAKFPDAVKQAGVPVEPQLPRHLQDLLERPERFDVVPNDLAAVKAFVAQHTR
ncbi:MAG: threonine synthase [Pseudomonadales bacterium]